MYRNVMRSMASNLNCECKKDIVEMKEKLKNPKNIDTKNTADIHSKDLDAAAHKARPRVAHAGKRFHDNY